MAKLVYALTGEGTWDVHLVGCADVTRQHNRRHYQQKPIEFEATTEAEARISVCDEGCQELGYDPNTDVNMYPCAVAALAETASGAIKPAATTVTIGYTRTDRLAGYYPMIDGYRDAADQAVRVITVQTHPPASPTEWAEALFVATNAPSSDGFSELELAVHRALEADDHCWRSLSVGDTVSVGGATLACANAGWEPVTSGHDCLTVGELEFVADHGAPGVGQAWRCRPCGRGWAKVGGQFHPPEDDAHLLRLEDVI